MGETGDAGQNLIRAFGPGEWFGMGIVGVEKLGDGALQFTDAAVRSTPDLFGGQLRKPATLVDVLESAEGKSALKV